MEGKDYYQVLGCNPDATAEDIKKSYREIAGRLHPDMVSPRLKNWAEQQMKLVNEAYGVLGNPQRRAQYDLARRNPSFGYPRAYNTAKSRAPSLLSQPAVRSIVLTLGFALALSMLSSVLRVAVWNPRGMLVVAVILGFWIATTWLRRKNHPRS